MTNDIDYKVCSICGSLVDKKIFSILKILSFVKLVLKKN